MQLISIVSEKDIKELILEVTERSKKENFVLMLSSKRCNELTHRLDVRRDSYDMGDWVVESNNVTYRIYENEHILCCKTLLKIVFEIVNGVAVVKNLDTFTRGASLPGDSELIIFIE